MPGGSTVRRHRSGPKSETCSIATRKSLHWNQIAAFVACDVLGRLSGRLSGNSRGVLRKLLGGSSGF
eukprot:10787430-Alexandrium_andersonii.AAC.1